MTAHDVSVATREFLRSAPFAQALATTIVGATVLAETLRSLMGLAGFLTLLVGLVVLAGASLVARRDMTRWATALPISLLVWLVLCVTSLIWSQYQWATLGGVLYLTALSVLGAFVALSRDTIQIIRLFGDVLRVVLAASLALEILSGVLIDSAIPPLGIEGNLAMLGPIQGLLHTTNQVGIIAILGLVTFIIEWRTRSQNRQIAVGSAIVAVIVVALTGSPVVYGLLVAVALAAGALYLVRRTPAHRRTLAQLLVLGSAVVATIVGWVLRVQIITAFDAAAVLEYRLSIWRQLLTFSDLHSLQGWGWIGPWHTGIPPYSAFWITGGSPGSALNAFLDVYLQLGFVGVTAFIGVVGLAFTRSWLLAGRKRSVIFTWPALVLVLLIASSLFESVLISDYGWVIFVVCAVKAGQELSWRRALEAPDVAPPLPSQAPGRA